VITTYRRNELLIEAISSIYSSIFHYRQNQIENNLKFEILIYDDDPQQNNSLRNDILARYEKVDSLTSIKYKINERNLGDYFNRNQGIVDAKGLFLKYIDDDDILYEDSISIITSTIKNNRFEERTYIYYLRDNFRHLKFPIELNSPEEIIRFHYQDYGLFHCSLVSTVFPSNFLKQTGGFFCKRFYGDFEMLNKISILSKFVIYPFELGYYRIHPNQESGFNRKFDRINFNYLLITIDFFRSNEIGIDNRLYKKIILSDNFNYLKRSIKSINVRLFFDVIQLYFLVFKLKKLKDLNTSNKWKDFYISRMSFMLNELRCLD
jgi:glycosyltransferase involved in cell wall biosynthesis